MGCVPDSESFNNTPRYTPRICLGIERIAAMVNTMIPIPHVEKMAVVTGRRVNPGLKVEGQVKSAHSAQE